MWTSGPPSCLQGRCSAEYGLINKYDRFFLLLSHSGKLKTLFVCSEIISEAMKTFFETQAINMVNARFKERKLPGAFYIGNLSHCATIWTLVFRFFAGSSKFKALGELITTFDVAVVIKAPDQKEFRLYPAKFNPSGHVNVYSKSLQWDHAPLSLGQINMYSQSIQWNHEQKHKNIFFIAKSTVMFMMY